MLVVISSRLIHVSTKAHLLTLLYVHVYYIKAKTLTRLILRFGSWLKMAVIQRVSQDTTKQHQKAERTLENIRERIPGKNLRKHQTELQETSEEHQEASERTSGTSDRMPGKNLRKHQSRISGKSSLQNRWYIVSDLLLWAVWPIYFSLSPQATSLMWPQVFGKKGGLIKGGLLYMSWLGSLSYSYLVT